MKLTAVYKKMAEGYIGFVEELPGANTQAPTLEEARESLREAVELIVETNRELSEAEIAGKNFIKEDLQVAA
jgi:predicted RNase H-like HicB family nuclease